MSTWRIPSELLLLDPFDAVLVNVTTFKVCFGGQEPPAAQEKEAVNSWVGSHTYMGESGNIKVYLCKDSILPEKAAYLFLDEKQVNSVTLK